MSSHVFECLDIQNGQLQFPEQQPAKGAAVSNLTEETESCGSLRAMYGFPRAMGHLELHCLIQWPVAMCIYWNLNLN